MLSHEITSIAGGHKKRKRIARGIGSGHGKTSGRGHKGSLSRAGAGGKLGYEGGSMPLFRRLPKRGFSNYNFACRYEIINVSQLDRFDNGAVIDVKSLFDAGLVNSIRSKIKVLGDGELTKKLQVSAHKYSKAAHGKILSCGGEAKIVA
ncbi:MAG: 50S ribosomal protein L15 [Planctomycetes bacterium]|nr:50S ribosomal protein L15 [Planctomycetota bacterium]MBU1517324.1 50S ribosomal protein L15 [Planctomycetota bacterium]MBU2458428.1 50S ribosomal protein L15 [Planctomycetota bacterium]MBU2596436.1 50S ribosomal protein L15 [Planctomycetota bacterium]